MARISKRVVDATRPLTDGKRSILWDDKLPGFGLLVLPSGIKSFVYDYRNAYGTKRRITIGKVGSIAPDKARKRAEDMAGNVKAGGDPLADKQERRQAATVGDVLDAYLESTTFKGKATSTQGTDRGRIERHVRPLLGKKHVEALTAEAVMRCFAAIRDGKTAARIKTGHRGLARVTGGEGAARMTIRLLRAILNWAVDERLIKSNAAAGIRLGVDGERDTILDDPEQYARLFTTLAKMEAEKRIRPPVADAIRVIALTGARRGEIAGLRWHHVNHKAARITLPPASHKTGKKTQKPRIITLPAVAQEIIARQSAGGPDDFVFAPAKGEGAVTLSKPWRKVRAEAKLPDGIGLHGLRHSLASHMAMAGAQAAEIMTTLGHRQMATSQKYVHWADNARAALAERAAAPALAGLAAASGKPSAEVVPIKGRADG